MAIATSYRLQNKESDFHKLLRSSRFRELEKMYYEHEQSLHRGQMANVLLQILQMQEVNTVKEYTINGNTFKVYVVEDTDL